MVDMGALGFGRFQSRNKVVECPALVTKWACSWVLFDNISPDSFISSSDGGTMCLTPGETRVVLEVCHHCIDGLQLITSQDEKKTRTH